MPAKSTRKRRSRKSDKPPKPYPDFPLSPHASGAWCKKIRGKIHYFGRWAKRENGKLVRVDGDGWKEALEDYKSKADDLHAGRTPRVTTDGLTVADLCNRFLTMKLRQLETGEITRQTFDDYKRVTDRIVGTFGKTRLVEDLASDDFESLREVFSETWGPVRLANAIQYTRTVFRYGFDSGLFDRQVRFGPGFKKPSANVLRRHQAKNGERMLQADQCRKLIDAAPVPLRAMILLGLNCGFGNHDCATLPVSAIDLEQGWVDYPRPKTGIPRRCPLWPETVEALKAAIAERPTPKAKEAEDAVFITASGRRWIVRGTANPVSVACRRLMKEIGIHQRGIGFYTLRHVFRTVADGARDSVAAGLIMGHSDHSMAANYRHGIEDGRLYAVVNHVRAWLWTRPTVG